MRGVLIIVTLSVALAAASLRAQDVSSSSSPAASPQPPQQEKSPSQSTRKPSSKARVRRKVAPPADDSGPKRIVVRQGGVDEPSAQIVPGVPPQEARRLREEAEDLLNSTRETLRQLAGQPFTPPQQENVSQIQNYMEGSRAALKAGDVSRAHTLALKAQLLAEDLTRK